MTFELMQFGAIDNALASVSVVAVPRGPISTGMGDLFAGIPS